MESTSCSRRYPSRAHTALVADGRGSVTFKDGFNGNPGAGTASKFSVVIVSAQQVQMEELDTFAAASGEADLQDTTSFHTAAFHGEYTFDFSGVDAATKPISSVGEFFADGVGGGAAEPAQEDVNDNGTLTSSAPTFSFQSVGANSRGLATLNGASYSFYMISAARVQFIALGSPASSVTAGRRHAADRRDAFSSTSLGGNSLLITNGNSTAGPHFQRGQFLFASKSQSDHAPACSIKTTAETFSSANFTGTYTVAANGRGTATLSTGADLRLLPHRRQSRRHPGDRQLHRERRHAGRTWPGGPFSTSNLAGGYAVQLTGVTAGIGEQDVVGQINLATARTGKWRPERWTSTRRTARAA